MTATTHTPRARRLGLLGLTLLVGALLITGLTPRADAAQQPYVEVLGPATMQFNCIAWSLGFTDRWINPPESIQGCDNLYGQLGFRRINVPDYRLHAGVDKVVLYAKQRPDGSWAPMHAARQLPDGTWSSKMGGGQLVRHWHPDDQSGPAYGIAVALYVRVRN